jgi:acetyl esterase/lipase
MTAPSRRAGWQGTPHASGPSLPPVLVRPGIRQLGRRVLDPSLGWEVQRRRLDQAMRALPVPRGTTVAVRMRNGVRTEEVTGARAAQDGAAAGTAHPERTVLHFHGGGYCVGSARMCRAWAARLSAQMACRVVLPEYRLAPPHAHPAALDDARAVLSALLSETAPGSVVLSGDSAGGGLALALALAARDAGDPLPAGCILMSPWLDLGRDRWAVPELVRRELLLSPPWLRACAAAYADPSKWADPSVSPLHAKHHGLPPLLIQAASDDLLAPDAEALAADASAARVDVTYTTWPRMWHEFALLPGLLAAADSALAQAAWFVETVAGP